MLLGTAYEFGSQEIPAPQATLMKTIIEGVLSGNLPWSLVLTGAGLSLGAMLCGVSAWPSRSACTCRWRRWRRSTSAGACAPWPTAAVLDAAEGEHDAGILAASGLVAGEGLAGVVVAGLVAAGVAPKSMEPWIAGFTGDVVALVVAAAVCYFLLRGGRANSGTVKKKGP